MGGGELADLAEAEADVVSLTLSGFASTLLPARLSVGVGDRVVPAAVPLATPLPPLTPLFGRPLVIPLFERLIPLD